MTVPLACQSLVKHFVLGGQTVRALDGVDLEIEPGLTFILGPSGSGKSTLLALLGLLDRPDHGRVLIDGQDPATLDDDHRADLRRERIGLVFQAYHLIPTLSARENVAVPLLPRRGANGALRRRSEELLDQVGLAPRAAHRPAELSGGERQRVAIARALIADPPILLADEPTGNLDSRTGAGIFEIFRRLAHEQGRAVLIVTHDQEAAARGDQVVSLRDGRIVHRTTAGAQS